MDGTSTNQPPAARICQGRLRGRWQAGVAAFHGVPYAFAPVGSARFALPRPPAHWHGVRDATVAGPAAPQPPSRLGRVMGDRVQEQAEDCLTLNIWAPDLSGPAKPVLVFLHGGGFSSGSGSLDWYDGAELARRGEIVVVTVNYRLGALGFVYLAGLTDGMGSGNFGLHDQAQALRWVRDNIAAFGGDPAAVTVAGQSAGAISIIGLLSGTTARGLFQRAIVQSLPGGMRPQTPAEAGERATEYLCALGSRPDQARSLRDRPVTELLAAQQVVVRQNAEQLGPVPPFQLVAERATVADDPIAAVGERAADGIRILVGTTRDEAAAFYQDEDQVTTLTSSLFRGPTLRLAGLLARHGNPAWVYQFDWSPPNSPFGACHCIELPFVFGNLTAWHDSPMLAGACPGTLAALVDTVQRTWIAFTRYGTPQHDGIPDWPSYQPEQPNTMHLSTTSTLRRG